MPFLDLHGARVRYRESGRGAGPPVLLIHGAGASSTLWLTTLHRLARVRRTVAPHLPGPGRSDGAPPSLAEPIARIVRRLCSRDPAARHASAPALLADLARLSDLDLPVVPPPRGERPGRENVPGGIVEAGRPGLRDDVVGPIRRPARLEVGPRIALLHLDDASQIQPNASGGAGATLGGTDMVGPDDPSPLAGRFAGGLGFAPSEGDLLAWPLALGSMGDLTVELWARPDALSGTRDVVVSGDGRVAVRVTQDSATTVRLSATMIENGGVMHTVTSAPIAAGAWHWVLATVQEPTLRLWVDGAASSASDVRLGTSPDLATLRIGGNYGGALDEVYISQSSTIDDEAALSRYCPL